MQMLATSKLTSKGQTTIPFEVREFLNLKPGDRLRYIQRDGVVELRAKTGRAVDLAGMFHNPGMSPQSVEEMDRSMAGAIADHTHGGK